MTVVLLEGFDHEAALSAKGWNGRTFGRSAGRLPYGPNSRCVSLGDSAAFGPIWKAVSNPSGYGGVAKSRSTRSSCPPTRAFS